MDCLKSFSLLMSGSVTPVSPNVEIWGLTNNFIAKTTGVGSGFAIAGFKNINIYKIEAVGRVESLFGATNCLIEDWGLFCQVVGQSPIIGGELSIPNNFGLSLQTVAPQFCLSKYNPSICFESPITSATLFSCNQINVQGIQAESATTVGIGWNINFNIYYDFEGE